MTFIFYLDIFFYFFKARLRIFEVTRALLIDIFLTSGNSDKGLCSIYGMCPQFSWDKRLSATCGCFYTKYRSVVDFPRDVRAGLFELHSIC